MNSIYIADATNVLLGILAIVILALVKPTWSFVAARLKIGQGSALYNQGLALVQKLGMLGITELTSIAAHNPTLAVPAAVATAFEKLEPEALLVINALGWTKTNVISMASGWIIKELGLTPTATEPAPLTSTEAAKAALIPAAPVAAGTAPVSPLSKSSAL